MKFDFALSFTTRLVISWVSAMPFSISRAPKFQLLRARFNFQSAVFGGRFVDFFPFDERRNTVFVDEDATPVFSSSINALAARLAAFIEIELRHEKSRQNRQRAAHSHGARQRRRIGRQSQPERDEIVPKRAERQCVKRADFGGRRR